HASCEIPSYAWSACRLLPARLRHPVAAVPWPRVFFSFVPKPALLAGRHFLLRCDGALARTLTRPSIRVRALAAHRQVATVTQAAIALNFNQPPDVHLHLLAEIAFDAALGFDGLTNMVDFVLAQVLDFLEVVHLGLGAQFLRARLANAVDGRQTNPETFIGREFNARDTCHVAASPE